MKENIIMNKCTSCGKKIDKNKPNYKCDVCSLRIRVSFIDSKLNKIERFLDRYLIELERQTFK